MPTNPMILYSFVNMKLRDEYASLEELCRSYDTDVEDVLERLQGAGFVYDEASGQFTAR